jgi:adenosylmethionine-8-amino-7-oxononanoate aminotransferase
MTRQCGFIAGIEVFRDVARRIPYNWKEKAGIRVCQELCKRGVLTRPVGDTIVLMPSYCVTQKQIERMVEALRESIVAALA